MLLISINPGAPNGGSGTQYFIGNFDGTTFTTDHDDEKWIDYGADNYAGVTYNNTPNNERIFIGWMSNWNYARNTPTEKWRSAMTLPRELSLHKERDAYFLKNYPIKSYENQYEKSEAIQEDLSAGALVFENIDLNQTDISFKVSLDENLQVQMRNSKNEALIFYIDTTSNDLILDRTHSGLVDFEKSFGATVHKQSYIPQKELVEIRIITDQSSVEVFVDKGRYVFTEQIFPTENYNTLLIAPEHTDYIEDFRLNLVKTIW